MAHKSKKKHIKHLHQHEHEAHPDKGQKTGQRDQAQPSGSSGERPNVSRRAGLTTKARDAARAAKDIAQTARMRARAKGAVKRGESGAGSEEPMKRASTNGRSAASQTRAAKKAPKGGIVRAIASAAGKKLADAATAKPRRVLSRAKARVRSLLHRDAA